jgi:hypothetical protein
MSTLNSHRPLNPVVGILEDNLLNSSADPRKAPNEIISLDHLIRAHTAAGSFVRNRKRHVPHPQTPTNTNIYTHAPACKRPSTIDFSYDICVIITTILLLYIICCAVLYCRCCCRCWPAEPDLFTLFARPIRTVRHSFIVRSL